MQDDSGAQKFKTSLSQIVFCLKPAYNDDDEQNELNSVVILSKMWLRTFGIKDHNSH